MNNKTNILLLVGIAIVVLGIVAWKAKKVSMYDETNKSVKSESIFMEATEVAKKDKDFYQITIHKEHKNSSIPKNLHTSSIQLQYIKKLLSMKTADVAKLDKAMHTFLMDKKIPRIDKINGIWTMLKDMEFISQQSEYLLDSLATLLPIELTQDLIDVYHDIKKPAIKMKLIAMLANNTTIANPNVQDEERLNFIVEQIQEIQSFLKEDVLKDDNPQILTEGLYAYTEISDPEDVQELITSLSNKENGISIPPEELSKVLTETAMSTQETQENILPILLDNIQNDTMKNPIEKENFNQMILEGINAGVLTQTSQQELSSYLKTQEPKLEIKKVGTLENISKYYKWAEATSKVKNSGVVLKEIALESNNPLKISSIILYADEKTIQQIKKNKNLGILYTKLESALEDKSISKRTKVIISGALSTIKENSK